MAPTEIIDYDDSFAHIAEQLYRYAADVPGPSRH
jgi:hypothetical protein